MVSILDLKKLFFALNLEVPEDVCSVLCEQVFEDKNDPATPEIWFISIVAGGDESSVNVPLTIIAAMKFEDEEYWQAPALDELINHEEVLGTLSPSVPWPIQSNSYSFFTQHKDSWFGWVNARQQVQCIQTNPWFFLMMSDTKLSCAVWTCHTQARHLGGYFSSWVVDKTLVCAFIAMFAMHHKHLLHNDIVSEYLQANLVGYSKPSCHRQCSTTLEQAFQSIFATTRIHSKLHGCLLFHSSFHFSTVFLVFEWHLQRQISIRILGSPKSSLGWMWCGNLSDRSNGSQCLWQSIQSKTRTTIRRTVLTAGRGVLYISVCFRLNIAFALSILTQQFLNPKRTHFELALLGWNIC